MNNPVHVRAVQAGDLGAWSALWDGYNAFYGRSGPTALAAEITRTTWSRFLDATEPVHALVAERDGTLVGLAHYLFHRNTIQLEPTCYLQDLFTDPAARGAGVGRALIAAVRAEAGTAEAERLYWHTHRTNATAMQLYDRVAAATGFVVYATSTAPSVPPD